MHMIAIGWLWVAFMMAITEKSLVAGLLTFLFYGLFPCAVLLYVLNKQAGKRREHAARRRARQETPQEVPQEAKAEEASGFGSGEPPPAL